MSEGPVANPGDDAYRRLVKVIADGAILFVGAGSSRRVGHPGWGDLLDTLHMAARKLDAAKADDFEHADGMVRAGEYKQILGETAFFKILRDAFSPKQPAHDRFHEILIELPFQHVLTTNYDNVLESAHQASFREVASSFDADDLPRLSAFRQGRTSAEHKRKYIHVHGSIGRPEGIVLCLEDYNNRYVRNTVAKTFLHEIFTAPRVVFVGFSLTDEDLNYLLREVAGGLQLDEPRHFALLPRSDNERGARSTYEKKYRVEPIFFDNNAGDFQALWTLIETLSADVGTELERRRALAPVPTAVVPETQPSTTATSPSTQHVLHAETIPSPPKDVGAGSSSQIDREIDTASKLIEYGIPAKAIQELEAIRARHGSSLNAKESYRVDANIGNALYSMGRLDEAADAYLRATGQYRESSTARGLYLLGLYLRGDDPGTLEQAALICASEPEFARAWSLWVRAHPDSAGFDDVEAAVPLPVRDDAEVALALSDFARRNERSAEQVLYARKAAASLPHWREAHATLGAAILASEKAVAVPDSDRGARPIHPELVAEAVAALSKAIEATPPGDPAGSAGGLFFNRSVAYGLLGDDERSQQDIREAFRRSPTIHLIAIGFALDAQSEVDCNAALASLDALTPDAEYDEQRLFATAWLLLQRKSAGDLDRAEALLRDLCSRPTHATHPTMAADAARLALRVFQELGRQDRASELIDSIPQSALSNLRRDLLRARAAVLAGNRDQSREHAVRALGQATSASWWDRRELALLTLDCGLFNESLALWQELLADNRTGRDSIHLVRAAYQADEWRTVLDVCDAVRRAGRTQPEHLAVELEVLTASREEERALTILKDWVRNNPTDRHAILQLSLLALRVEDKATVIFDESRLPSLRDIRSAREGAGLVYVLRRGPTPMRALEVAYELHRRFPDDPASHATLMSCVFDVSESPLPIVRPTIIGDNTAAYVQRQGETPRWVYVETAPDPASSRNEFSRSHEFVRAMWGHAVSESFEYEGRTYSVLGVENRLLRRVHEVMERYEETFPQHPLVRRFAAPVNPPDNAPLEEKLGELYPELDRHDRRRQMLVSIYQTQRLPVATFAKQMGRPLFSTFAYLAADPTNGIRADSGSHVLWAAGIAALDHTSSVVLDGTALAAARVLGTLDSLPALGIKFLVPKAVLDEVRELSLDAARNPETFGLSDGKPFWYRPSPEQAAKSVEEFERIISFVRTHCEVVGGEATLDLPADVRGKLERIMDDASIDAAALAAKRRLPLWTEDLGLEQVLASLDIRVVRVWTQLVMKRATDAGRINGAVMRRTLGRLLECGYQFTRLAADDIADVLEDAGWQLESGAGAGVLRNLKDVAVVDYQNQAIVALAIRQIWLNCPRSMTAKRLIVSILDSIAQRQYATDIASFIYRGRPLIILQPPPTRPLVALAGRSRANRYGPYLSDLYPFSHPDIRPLKQFLRSWRSRNGSFSRSQQKSLPPVLVQG